MRLNPKDTIIRCKDKKNQEIIYVVTKIVFAFATILMT